MILYYCLTHQIFRSSIVSGHILERGQLFKVQKQFFLNVGTAFQNCYWECNLTLKKKLSCYVVSRPWLQNSWNFFNIPTQRIYNLPNWLNYSQFEIISSQPNYKFIGISLWFNQQVGTSKYFCPCNNWLKLRRSKIS